MNKSNYSSESPGRYGFVMYLPWILIINSMLTGCDSEQINSQQHNALSTHQEFSKQNPNIVLVMVDDMGWGDTGYNGHPKIHTPNLDDMAANGLVFDRFYAAAPVCSPTRGSVMTGRHPFRYGVYYANVGHLPEEEYTIAEMLKEQNYRTGFFGKWHLGTLSLVELDSNRGGREEHKKDYSPPWLHGFDVVFTTESKVPTYDPMLKPKQGYQETWWDPVANPGAGESFGTAYWKTDGKRETANLSGDDSRVIVDRAIPFIKESIRQGKPFLAVIWLHSPHLPVVAGEADTLPFTDQDKFTQHYYGSIKALDREVGRVRSVLDELGIKDNTVLWFTSDNGPEHHPDYTPAPGSTGGLRGAKRSLYEGGIRVPGIIEWPVKIRQGRRIKTIAVTSDILPTIQDIVSGEKSDNRILPLDGISLKEVIFGKPIERTVEIGFESAYQTALIGQRFKIIHQPELTEDSQTDPNLSGQILKEASREQSVNVKSAGQNPSIFFEYELYDLEADPDESNDVAKQYPEVVKLMSEKLQAWRISVDNSIQGNDYK